MKLEDILKKYLSEEVLTDDVKTEIETLFETLVNESVQAKIEIEKTTLEDKYTVELKEFKEGLVEKLSDYMEETFGEWFETNKPEMVSEIKVSIADNTTKMLRNLLSENYVEVKDEDVDVVADLEKKLEESGDEVNELGNSKIDLKKEIVEQGKQIFEYQKAVEFTKLTDGMNVSDKEKLLKLIEDIEAADIESFNEKVKIIKEKYMEKLEEGDEETIIEDPNAIITEGNDSVDKYLPKTFV
jgi:hypothetical protein